MVVISSLDRINSPNRFFKSSAMALSFAPITMPVMVVTRAIPIPTVQPRGPVPKASREPPTIRASPMAVLRMFSHEGPSKPISYAPEKARVIPVTMSVIPNATLFKPPFLIASIMLVKPFANFQVRKPAPMARTTSKISSKWVLIHSIIGCSFSIISSTLVLIASPMKS